MIIAETGVNHNGDLDIAKRLAKEAKNAGADVIKYQTFWDISWLKEYEFKEMVKWLKSS